METAARYATTTSRQEKRLGNLTWWGKMAAKWILAGYWLFKGRKRERKPHLKPEGHLYRKQGLREPSSVHLSPAVRSRAQEQVWIKLQANHHRSGDRRLLTLGPGGPKTITLVPEHRALMFYHYRLLLLLSDCGGSFIHILYDRSHRALPLTLHYTKAGVTPALNGTNPALYYISGEPHLRFANKL